MTFPSRRSARHVAPLATTLVAGSVLLAWATPLRAQRVDTTQARKPAAIVRSDSATVPRSGGVGRSRILGPAAPPISTRRAFVYSLLVPGLGQSRLDRGTAGAFFAAIEVGSWAMMRKTSADLREARRFSGDTVPNSYIVGSDGKLTPTGTFPERFPAALVNTRRLHVEDWIAAVAFNHLISGADAFVAAQLWDVPTRVSVRPSVDGVALVASLRW